MVGVRKIYSYFKKKLVGDAYNFRSDPALNSLDYLDLKNQFLQKFTPT